MVSVVGRRPGPRRAVRQHGGGVITLSVKPGAGKLHGAAHEHPPQIGLIANTYANLANAQPRADRIADQYGFAIDCLVYLPKQTPPFDATAKDSIAVPGYGQSIDQLLHPRRSETCRRPVS